MIKHSSPINTHGNHHFTSRHSHVNPSFLLIRARRARLFPSKTAQSLIAFTPFSISLVFLPITQAQRNSQIFIQRNSKLRATAGTTGTRAFIISAGLRNLFFPPISDRQARLRPHAHIRSLLSPSPLFVRWFITQKGKTEKSR